MTMKKILLPICVVAAVLILGCATARTDPSMTLKDAFKNDFTVGVAVNQRQFTGEDSRGAALVAAQFNALTPENVLKWEKVHPQPGTNGYDFGLADAYVAFGEKNKMLLVGHTLAWHSQTPRWVFEDENGRRLSGTNAADRELLLNRLREHINTVVGRYKGRIKIWDVVNEALNDSKSESDTNVLRRASPWVQVLGEEYIVKAFEWAHAADPDAILRYNDYAIENPAKRARLIALIKDLQAKHVPVMAIGSQTHANLTWPDSQLEDETLTDIAKLGLPIHITELDVNGSVRGQNFQSADVAEVAAAGDSGLVESADEMQARQYANLFGAFLKHRDEIKLVTLWGVTDADSWLRNGRPLLFDGNWQPKPAFEAVMKTVRQRSAMKSSEMESASAR
jgi:endo-1,4-beta-xylanase